MKYRVYFTNGGVPKTGLTPTWNALITGTNGTDKSGSAPTITELAGGYYLFDITFAVAPWDVPTEDLVGVIDGGSALVGAERYKPVAITLRGLGLARVAHKAVQDKSTGDVDIYKTDGSSKEMKLDMTDASGSLTRNPVAAG